MKTTRSRSPAEEELQAAGHQRQAFDLSSPSIPGPTRSQGPLLAPDRSVVAKSGPEGQTRSWSTDPAAQAPEEPGLAIEGGGEEPLETGLSPPLTAHACGEGAIQRPSRPQTLPATT